MNLSFFSIADILAISVNINKYIIIKKQIFFPF